MSEAMVKLTLSKLFCVFQNSICFFPDKVKCWPQSSTIPEKTRKFLLCNKSKMLQFSRKMCFKRAKFCIIQRRVKCRCILLLQIFSFLLRWLLTLVKVHIMLYTFRNGTTKSLILTLNMFKRFFFIFI